MRTPRPRLVAAALALLQTICIVGMLLVPMITREITQRGLRQVTRPGMSGRSELEAYVNGRLRQTLVADTGWVVVAVHRLVPCRERPSPPRPTCRRAGPPEGPQPARPV